jgi:hypothetical protein
VYPVQPSDPGGDIGPTHAEYLRPIGSGCQTTAPGLRA